MSDIAKIIRSDGTQAVQLPPEFRFDGDTVQIRRDGDAVILEPIDDEWGWLEDIAIKLDQAVLGDPRSHGRRGAATGSPGPRRSLVIYLLEPTS